MTSLAAHLSSIPSHLPASSSQAGRARPSTPQPAAPRIPQRFEGSVDVQGGREVERVSVNSLVLLKLLKHATDPLPPPPVAHQSDRNPPPQTALSSKPDAVGVLLGLDLDGVLEVEDCLAVPAGETAVGPGSHTHALLEHLSLVSVPDSMVGIYFSTYNGGFLNRQAMELLANVEKAEGRGRAVVLIHDKNRELSGTGVGLTAWKMREGVLEEGKKGKWDSATLADHKITPGNLLTPLPLAISNPSLLSALMSSLSAPASSASAPSPSLPLSLSSPTPTPAPGAPPLAPSFSTLSNPLPHSLPSYLSSTLDALTLHAHESNNVAFLVRQIARERARQDGLVKEREEENARRRKQGLGELPAVPAEARGGAKDPNRLELLVLSGMVDTLTKGMGQEAGTGLVRCYL